MYNSELSSAILQYILQQQMYFYKTLKPFRFLNAGLAELSISSHSCRPKCSHLDSLKMHFQLYPHRQGYANVCTSEALLRQPNKSGRWFTEPPYLLTPKEVDRLDNLMSHLDAHNAVWKQSNFNRGVLHWKLASYQRFSHAPAAEHTEIKIMRNKCLLTGLALSLWVHSEQRKHWLCAGQQLSIYNTSLAVQNTNVSHTHCLSISVSYSFCSCPSLSPWYSISFTLGL